MFDGVTDVIAVEAIHVTLNEMSEDQMSISIN